MAALVLSVRCLLAGEVPRRRTEPLEILREGYTRGDLSQQEIEAMRHELERS